MAIFSTKKFLRKLKVGGKFWHIDSAYMVPHKIIGPCTILAIKDVKFTGLCGVQVVVSYKRENGSMGESFVGDITNEFHGVFLTEKSALKHYSKKKKAYKTNPVLIKEVEDAKKKYREALEE